MLDCESSGNAAYRLEPDDEERIFPVALELKKTSHYYHFLRRELIQAKTEVEREVVRSELDWASAKLLGLKTKFAEMSGRPPEDLGPATRFFWDFPAQSLQ